MEPAPAAHGLEALSVEAVKTWFAGEFPAGPTPIQAAAWPRIARREHSLIIAPTGAGKTLAAFLSILDRLLAQHSEGCLGPGVHCLYITPLRSLGYDIERNLLHPLDSLRILLDLPTSPIRIGVRTGDTTAWRRRRMADSPPQLLITTPESLALLLSQQRWREPLARVESVIVDEVHALVATKRGADLAVSLERLSALATCDPARIGLSATCRPTDHACRFLVGTQRSCAVVEAPDDPADGGLRIEIQSLIEHGEPPHRTLTYKRLLRQLRLALTRNRTTIVFANTRAFSEKLTHDLRLSLRLRPDDAPPELDPETLVVHHSALDAARRRQVEADLKQGLVRMVISSTSLELGVDIGSADEVIQIGLPGSIARCVQRVGRSGRRRGATRRGLVLAATPAELVAAAVIARKAQQCQIEPVGTLACPLDVLCQQLVGMACAGEWSDEVALALLRRTAPFESLPKRDFDDCLAFLSGTIASPPAAGSAEVPAAVAWTSPRLWRAGGRFGVRSRRVVRWLWSNIGTIVSQETTRVFAGPSPLGTIESDYAGRLERGDRFVLDGRAFVLESRAPASIHVRSAPGEAALPRWHSERQSLSRELATRIAHFREEAGRIALERGPAALRRWFCAAHCLHDRDADVLGELFEGQAATSEIPPAGGVLIEESPAHDGFLYAFHAPLSRAACEALAQAVGARLGRLRRRKMNLSVSDLGWTIDVPDDARLDPLDVARAFGPTALEQDVISGLDHGDLLANRFRHVAATALMVLKNPEGGARRVGGMDWVSRRLYPLVRATCPDHPLLRETRREVLEDVLDIRSARRFLEARPAIRFRRIDGISPFTSAWLGGTAEETLRFEPPVEALRRLHARLTGGHARAPQPCGPTASEALDS
jgi:ATP-dependent Lhr-like helicase